MKKLLIFMMIFVAVAGFSGCSSEKALPKAQEGKLTIVNHNAEAVKDVMIAVESDDFGKSVLSAPLKTDESTAVSLMGGREIDKTLLFKVKVVLESGKEMSLEKSEAIAEKNYLIVGNEKIETK